MRLPDPKGGRLRRAAVLTLAVLLLIPAGLVFGQAAPAKLAYGTRAIDAADLVRDPRQRLAIYDDLLPVLGRLKQADAVARVAAAGVKLARGTGDRTLLGEHCAAVA